jgi:hypothetical protein
MEIIIAIVVLAFLAGFSFGDWLGYRSGIVGGYGAVMWPDSVYFNRPRQWLNTLRQKDGLPPIEEMSTHTGEA